MSILESQIKALEWLSARNGNGVFNRRGVVLAAGETAPFMRSTWNRLVLDGHLEVYDKKRVRLTEKGLGFIEK